MVVLVILLFSFDLDDVRNPSHRILMDKIYVNYKTLSLTKFVLNFFDFPKMTDVKEVSRGKKIYNWNIKKVLKFLEVGKKN